jgi:hypothetical protein
MGEVIRFPIERRLASTRAEAHPHQGSASIVILPVVRIERHDATGKVPAAASSAVSRLPLHR